MDLKDLKKLSVKDLKKNLNENREKLRDLRFKISQRQHKDVREFRVVKKTIARIMTLINQNKESK